MKRQIPTGQIDRGWGETLDWVIAGGVVELTKYGRPVARVVGVPEDKGDLGATLARLTDSQVMTLAHAANHVEHQHSKPEKIDVLLAIIEDLPVADFYSAVAAIEDAAERRLDDDE